MIRPINRDDKDFFIDSCREFYSSSAVMHAVSEKNFEKTFSLLMQENPYARCYIYETEGKKAAYLLISITYSNECGGIVVWLEEMFVLPRYRSRGIGSELFRYVENEYKNAACRFRLEATRENERAIALYKKLGYHVFDYLQMVKE
ncbi:MAG: GNAT family N-acetyltransferase [Christensenellales bacterium]